MSEDIGDVDCDNESSSGSNGSSNRVRKGDFLVVGSNLISNINFKMCIFLFFIGMIIFSDLFIDGVLSKISNSVNGECTTTKGTIIQLVIFVLLYLVVDLLIKGDWV